MTSRYEELLMPEQREQGSRESGHRVEDTGEITDKDA